MTTFFFDQKQCFGSDPILLPRFSKKEAYIVHRYLRIRTFAMLCVKIAVKIAIFIKRFLPLRMRESRRRRFIFAHLIL